MTAIRLASTSETIDLAAPPRGDLSDEARRLIAERARPNTVRAYSTALRTFDAWCNDQHRPWSDPGALADYLAVRARTVGAESLAQTVKAVRAACKASGRSTDGPEWQSVAAVLDAARAALVKEGREQPRGASQALRLDDLHAAVAALYRVRGPQRPRALRDRAILTIGFLAGLRRNEIAALDCKDIRAAPEGLEVTIRGAKTTRTAETHATLPRGRHPVTCPVAAWEDWRRERPAELPGMEDDAPAFLKCSRTGRPLNERIGDDHTIGRLIRRALSLTGIDGSRYSAHSLRAGLATELSERGVSLASVANAGRWESLDTVLRYARRARRWQDSPLHALGY